VLELSGSLFIPVKELKAIRREALAQLGQKKTVVKEPVVVGERTSYALPSIVFSKKTKGESLPVLIMTETKMQEKLAVSFLQKNHQDGILAISFDAFLKKEEEELTEITRKANANGVTMHVHVMGNKAVSQVVNAFVNGGKDEMRNTLVHVYNVCPEDYQRMADHNIQVAGGLLWHHADEPTQEELLRILPEGLKDKGYPMKSFFDHGVNVSSHSDFPALSGSPDDPFSIMEIAVTGVYYVEHAKPWWTEELLTREQVLTALTINVAKQMFIEEERGSISAGKYADFLLVDKDVLTCPVTEIHNAKPAATYFEGKKVYPM
jgi:predicted amidohydrolase YtcJ